jgi:aromatic ring-cleaving dioxygenase
MFEVNVFTPHQTGALFSWLTVNRGPCSSVNPLLSSMQALKIDISVLVHPNTGDAYADHTELMSWMGKPWPLNVEILKKH